MKNRNNNVITREDFEFRKRIHLPYEGFVEGLGYVSPKPVTVRVSKNPYYNLYSVENNMAYIVIPLPDDAIPVFEGRRMPKVVEEQKHPEEIEAERNKSREVTVAGSGETIGDKHAQIREAMNWQYNGANMHRDITMKVMLYETMPRLNFLASTGLGMIDLGAGFHQVGGALSNTAGRVGNILSGGNLLFLASGIILDGAAAKANKISSNKAATNIGVSVTAFGIGQLMSAPIGLTLSAGYFGIDNYYPGGWQGYGRDMIERHRTRPYAGPKY